MATNQVFIYGERVLLLDKKRRRYLVELVEGGEFHSHAGFVPHADMVEAVEGDGAAEHSRCGVHRAEADS